MKLQLRKMQGKRRIGLKMAPLIDIIFLLLIFFLVTAQWRPEENHLPMKLSATAAHAVQPPRTIPLELRISTEDSGCMISFADQQVLLGAEEMDGDLNHMLSSLAKALENQKRLANDPIEIHCDRDVKWLYLARIYNSLYGAGFTDITFAVYEN